MAKDMHKTPMLDALETGPWPSFVTGLKRLAKDKDYVVDLLGQLEHSYATRKGYWKGGTVGVFGYGGGVIPRFTEAKDESGKPMFPDAAEFHTLRVMPPPGMHYSTDILRKMCDIWEEHGSGLIAFHGQSGDIMFQGVKSDKVQDAFDAINELGFDLGGVAEQREVHDIPQAHDFSRPEDPFLGAFRQDDMPPVGPGPAHELVLEHQRRHPGGAHDGDALFEPAQIDMGFENPEGAGDLPLILGGEARGHGVQDRGARRAGARTPTFRRARRAHNRGPSRRAPR